MIPQNIPFLPPFEEYSNLIKRIWESKHLTNSGPIEQEFVTKLEGLGFKNVSTVVNGHMALEACIDVFDLTGEVITTPFTFASTITAIHRKGLTPIFADIDVRTFNIDPKEIEKKITSKTTAIFAVHVFGNLSDHNALRKIADKHGLKLIYDAAHCFGCYKDDENVSLLGDASMFSLHATKVMHSVEGGLVTFKEESDLEKFKLLKNFGIQGDTVVLPGGNLKMNEFSAAMGVVNLNYIDSIIEKRKFIFQLYLDRLRDETKLSFQHNSEANFTRNFAYFPIVLEQKIDRDDVFDKLNQYGVNVRKYFYPLATDYEFLTPCDEYSNAKRVSDSILTLPLYADLSLEDANLVCDKLIEVLNEI